jgi:hydrogenase maturation protein HypF
MPTPFSTLTGNVAISITITGVVQGVGFRPFVHGVAIELGLAGQVRNT